MTEQAKCAFEGCGGEPLATRFYHGSCLLGRAPICTYHADILAHGMDVSFIKGIARGRRTDPSSLTLLTEGYINSLVSS